MLAIVWPGCNSSLAQPADAASLQADHASRAQLLDTSSGDDWPGFGRTYGEQHYSPLDQIDVSNVTRLGLAWSLDLTPGHSLTGPIEVRGVLYFANRHNIIHAVDAVEGRVLWVFDSHAAERAGRRLRQSYGTRGIAWWNGKIYTGTTDGRLIAIDGQTGREVWSVMTVPDDEVRFINGAPRAFDGKIIVGHGGADAGPTRGYVTTYDAETGKLLWRFHTVPGNPAEGFEDEAMEMAAKTWSGEWWKFGGGGTVWNAITYDAETATIFLGTGNGYPWNHRIRSAGEGDNLFLSSIVALDAHTGKYKWHYQTNPGETWDYNAAMDMQLADLVIDGQRRKTLLTAPKNGFFYVIDRLTGKLISAEPFAKQNWASHIDHVTGRPIEVPEARFPDGSTFLMWPGALGAHNWLPMAYSPKTKLVYLPTIEMANTFSDEGIDVARWTPSTRTLLDGGVIVDFSPKDAGPLHGTSYLQAWDPVAQRQVWRIPTPGVSGGGTVATGGGLVFQGQLDGKFNAYSAVDGKPLWTFDAKAPVLAPPITYLANGRQFVTVITGAGSSWGLFASPLPVDIDYRTQARRVLTFALGGTATLPPGGKIELPLVMDPTYRSDSKSAARGGLIYDQACVGCHGFEAVAAGTAPDLRKSTIVLEADAFRSIVKDGALTPNGMPQFDEYDARQLDDIRQYIRSRAQMPRK